MRTGSQPLLSLVVFPLFVSTEATARKPELADFLAFFLATFLELGGGALDGPGSEGRVLSGRVGLPLTDPERDPDCDLEPDLDLEPDRDLEPERDLDPDFLLPDFDDPVLKNDGGSSSNPSEMVLKVWRTFCGGGEGLGERLGLRSLFCGFFPPLDTAREVLAFESANVTLLCEWLMRDPSFSSSLARLRVIGPWSMFPSSLSTNVAEVGPDMAIL